MIVTIWTPNIQVDIDLVLSKFVVFWTMQDDMKYVYMSFVDFLYNPVDDRWGIFGDFL